MKFKTETVEFVNMITSRWGSKLYVQIEAKGFLLEDTWYALTT